MYRCRESSIRYNPYARAWQVGSQHQFPYPQIADVFVYCWKNYSPATALKVGKLLQERLETTLGSYLGQAAADEAKAAVTDYLLGKLGAPSLPGPAGVALKVLEALGTAVGDAYLKEKIRTNRAFRNDRCDFSPERDTSTYCNFVLYSWVIDPVRGPYYATILPGSLR